MAELRTMLGLLVILWVLLFPGRLAGIRLEQPALVVARSGSSVTLSCRANTKVSYIHWYQHQEGNAPRRLLIVALFSSYVQTDSVLKGDKVTARRGSDGKSCNLLMSKLEKSDEAVYYCAAWEADELYDWNNKVFGPGTHLRVTDKSPNEDISPKPTIFLPSVAEKRLHDAGTYLCLLEDFFPDIIKIDWQEKDGKRILTSQQGDTMKTKDTYMKFSWLTVTGASLDKDHKCIVTHKNNKGGVDQEILFPSIKKGLVAMMGSKVDFQGHPETRAPKTGVVTVSPLRSLSLSPFSRAIERTAINFTKDSLKEEKAALQLQLTNTSAYYTHVLLLVKSLVYSAIMAVCLLGRPALCGSGTSS